MTYYKTGELGEFITLKRGYDLPQQNRKNGCVPIFSSSGISGTHDAAMVKAPGVITGRYGTIGQVFMANEDFWPLNTTLYVEDFHGNNPRFIYYFLKTLEWEKFTSASAVPGINRNTVHKEVISLPDIETQDKIASVLKTLDDKIEINQKINDNLRQQIRTLCNAWLNDYVPFGGVCPDDWELTPLASIAKFISGYSYKGTELQDSNIAMATIKNFDRKGGFKLDGYKEIVPSSKLKSEHHAELFDTLVAHTDLTQNAEVIGNAEPVLSFSGYDEIIFSMDVVKVIPNSPSISKFLIAAMLQTQKFKDHCLGYVNGTTVLHLSKKALPEYLLRLPHDFTVIQPLDDAVSSMYQQMALNIDESVRLAALRNSLLPKLMSGEIDVSGISI